MRRSLSLSFFLVMEWKWKLWMFFFRPIRRIEYSMQAKTHVSVYKFTYIFICRSFFSFCRNLYAIRIYTRMHVFFFFLSHIYTHLKNREGSEHIFQFRSIWMCKIVTEYHGNGGKSITTRAHCWHTIYSIRIITIRLLFLLLGGLFCSVRSVESKGAS